MTDGMGYAEIADHYRKQIISGDLSPGDKLPPLRTVCELFGVAKATANRAFQQLKNEGLTTPRGSAGTEVAPRPNAVVTGAARLSRLRRTGHAYAPGETSTGHVAMLRSCADPDTAEQLGIEPHDEVVIRMRVFRTDGIPASVGLSCTHVRALIDVPELLDQGPLRPLWHETYAQRTGRTIHGAREQRTARIASADELEALEVNLVPPGAAVAVLVTRVTFYDENGPIDVWEDVYAPGKWQEGPA